MDIPKWLLQREGITTRQWKSRKRRELKALKKAFDAYRVGCAYTPAKEGEVGRISDAIGSLCHELSAKKWGR